MRLKVEVLHRSEEGMGVEFKKSRMGKVKRAHLAWRGILNRWARANPLSILRLTTKD